MQFITITIKSFDFLFVKKAIKNIQKICHLFSLNNVKVSSLPLPIKRFTVERSPHIDKKSREQFEMKKYKMSLKIKIRNKRTVTLFLYILKNSTYPGVELSISTQFYDFLFLDKQQQKVVQSH